MKALHIINSLNAGPAAGLFEINAHSLVKQMVLEGLVSEILQAEQAGGIAFVDGDFKVIGRIEQRQFFARRQVGIGFTDALDDFVAFEHDPETPAPPLFFECVAGDVDDHIFEIVNKDDLSLDIVVSQQRPEVILFGEGEIGAADLGEAVAGCELSDRLANDPGTVKGIFDGIFVQRDAHHFFGLFGHNHAQEAVVGTENILATVPGQQDLFGFLFKEIDQDDMIGIRWKLPDGVPADIGGLREIEGRNLVADIMNPEIGIDLQKLAFYGAADIILLAKIGGKGNKGHLRRNLFLDFYFTSSPSLK